MTNRRAGTVATLLLAITFANSRLFVAATSNSSHATAVRPRVNCSRIHGLSVEQIAICEEYPNLINCIRAGYRMSVRECKFQFRKHRWNCTKLGKTSRFGERAIPGTREAAYAHAIIYAGVVHAIASACNAGNLSECTCDWNKLRQIGNKAWMRVGRGVEGRSVEREGLVDLSNAMDVSDRFVNARHSKEDAIFLMNKHNSRAGRQVFQESVRVHCKCHPGLFKDCVFRTCWGELPSIRHVGEILKESFDGAQRMVKRMSPSGRLRLQSVNKSSRLKINSLVYLHHSPSFCTQNARLGISGTRGRFCNSTSVGLDGCMIMCCGRGYNSHYVTKASSCNCKIHKCEECVTNVIKHTCK